MNNISKRWIRKYANWAEAKGLISSQNICEDCGASNPHKHHEDYSNPLKITWLCPKCHIKRHGGVIPWDSSREGITGFEQIEKLLALGVSTKAISEYLRIAPQIVNRVCRNW